MEKDCATCGLVLTAVVLCNYNRTQQKIQFATAKGGNAACAQITLDNLVL